MMTARIARIDCHNTDSSASSIQGMPCVNCWLISARWCGQGRPWCACSGVHFCADLTSALRFGKGPDSQAALAAQIQSDQKIRRSDILQDGPLSLAL